MTRWLGFAVVAWALTAPAGARAQTSAAAPASQPAERKLTLKRLALLGDPRWRHGGTPTHILPMPDGKTVLVSARDGSARLWDLASGKEIRRFAHEGGKDVWNVCLLPGGREILTAGENQRVTRWSLESAEPLSHYAHDSIVFRIALAESGRQFVACDNKNQCIMWDLESGKEIRRFRGHESSVYTALFAFEGKTLLTGSGDGTVRFWDVQTGEQKYSTQKVSYSIYTLAPSPDGKEVLACCSKDGLGLWKMDAAGNPLWKASLPNEVKVAAWSPDGKAIAAVSSQARLYVLDSADGKMRRQVELPGGTHWSVAYSVDGKQILCGADYLLCRFDAESGERIFPAPGAPAWCSEVELLAPVPNSNLIAAAGGQGGVRLYNMGTGAIDKDLLAGQRVHALVVSPDGRMLLTRSNEQAPQLMELPGGKVRCVLGHAESREVAFAQGGKLAVTTSYNEVGMWRVEDGKAVRNLPQEDGGVDDLAVSPDGSLLAVTCGQNLRIWDAAGGSEVAYLQGAGKGCRGIRFFSAGGGGLLIADETTLSCWSASAGGGAALSEAEVQRLISQLGGSSYRSREEATQKLIAAGPAVLPALASVRSADPEVLGRVRQIRLEVQKRGSTYRKTDSLALELAHSIQFHPDGRRWAAVRGEGSAAVVVLGAVEGGKLRLLGTIEDENMPNVVAFALDGRLCVGNRNGTISIYAAP